jgi:hypothetical protein
MELVYNYHWTFQDVFSYLLDAFDTRVDLYQLTTLYGFTYGEEETTILSSKEVTKMFCDFVYPMAYDKDFCISDTESTVPVDNPDIKQALRRLVAYILESYPYYSRLIALYDKDATALLAQVTETTDSKTGDSDMPQTATFESAPTSDVLSMLQKVTATTKQDYGTIMQRLDEIRKNYVSLYREWADEVLKEFVLY